MIHVLLRIAVWVAVFGIGYLLFGPQLFDSPRSSNPFASKATLFLPPAKSDREFEYEEILKKMEEVLDKLKHIEDEIPSFNEFFSHDM